MEPISSCQATKAIGKISNNNKAIELTNTAFIRDKHKTTSTCLVLDEDSMENKNNIHNNKNKSPNMYRNIGFFPPCLFQRIGLLHFFLPQRMRTSIVKKTKKKNQYIIVWRDHWYQSISNIMFQFGRVQSRYRDHQINQKEMLYMTQKIDYTLKCHDRYQQMYNL